MIGDWYCVVSIFGNAALTLIVLWLSILRDQDKGGIKRLEQEVEWAQYNCPTEVARIRAAAEEQEKKQHDF